MRYLLLTLLFVFSTANAREPSVYVYNEICSFDPQGVKLKTSAETAKQQSGGDTGRSTVSQMAKKATAKRIG